MVNLSDIHILEVSNLIQKVETQKEYQQMLENLEEGIIVAKEKKITFSNSVID